MRRLLVTGSSGFLGWNVCQLASQEWAVYGTYFSHSVASSNFSLIKVNLTNFSDVKELFSLVKPDAVLHLAAQSKPNSCQLHPEISYQINVTATLNIANLCADLNIPLGFTSTDLVFSGKNAPYQESDSVSPINLYGEQKATAEEQLLTVYPNTVIARMPLMFGHPSPVAESFLQGFIKTLKAGQELSLFTDEYRTPVSGLTAAKGLLLALEKCQGEIIHLGGKERISRYEFGCIMAEMMALPLDKITQCKQKDVLMAAPRPADVSLNSNKAFSLGYHPLSIRDELKLLLD